MQNPMNPSPLFAKASALFDRRRCWEARAVCLEAHASGLESFAFYLLAGWCSFGAGKPDEAELLVATRGRRRS